MALLLTTLRSEIIDDKAELKLEVWSHSTLGSDKMIGECNVGLPSTFPREHILDSWFDLKVKPGKKVVVSKALHVKEFLMRFILNIFVLQGEDTQKEISRSYR